MAQTLLRSKQQICPDRGTAINDRKAERRRPVPAWWRLAERCGSERSHLPKAVADKAKPLLDTLVN
jgi:hypothetical protein